MKTSICALALVAVSVAPGSAQTRSVLPTQADTAAPRAVQEFVAQTFAHGIPFDQARALGPAAVPVLTKLLQEAQKAGSAEEPTLANIAVTLGILGDPSSVDPLIDLIQSGNGRLGRQSYAARTSALMALGYLVNASGDSRALKYLQDSANPAAWGPRKLGWESPFAQSAAERDQQLAEIAVLGLALTGKPEALTILQQMASRTNLATPAESRATKLAADAVKESQIIARDGLSAYYKRRIEVSGR
jgi:HEAT repeat protein